MANGVDLFQYAAGVVNHKTVWQRIAHSPALHTARSAFSSEGSAVSKFIKLSGVAARGACHLVPIPVLGPLAETLEKFFEGKGRAYFHDKNLEHAEHAKDLGEKVKFELKELSLEEMDRYRWKVNQSVTDLNNAAQRFNDIIFKGEVDHASCAGYVELAIMAEQVKRRTKKLHDKCSAVLVVLANTLNWLGKAYDAADTVEDDLADAIAKKIQEIDAQLQKIPQAQREEYRKEFVELAHAHCAGWCWAKPLDAPTYSHYQAVERSAAVLKFVTSMFPMDSLAGLAEIAKPYLGEK
jgi:hypothetical protein